MKKYFLFLFSLIVFSKSFGQNITVRIEGINEIETKILDSLWFKKKHKDLNSILNLKDSISYKLHYKGFLEQKILVEEKVTDSLYSIKYNLGNKTKSIHIYIGINKSILNIKEDFIILETKETETFLLEVSNLLEKKGFSVSSVILENFIIKNNKLNCDLKIDLDIQRKINDIVFDSNLKLPNGLIQNLKRKHNGKIFNSNYVEKINKELNSIRYIKQIKYPEVLFTKDSTKIYVFLEKLKSNSFDGYLGFSNSNTKKLALNGYIDLNLNNALNSGENISLKWRNDANSQRTLNVSTEIPYLFKSPVGIKVQLNIFKQDTTFQNSRFSIDALYNLNFKSKIYIGYSNTESSDINNINNSLLNDYESKYFNASFEFRQDIQDSFFDEKTLFSFNVGSGKRISNLFTNNQITISTKLNHLFTLNERNFIFVSNQNFLLLSNQFLTNELFRFGGIKSIRGFNENSLQGNNGLLLLTEYRYKPTNNFYIHTIVDYGSINDKTLNISNKLFGFGGGIGLLTKTGIFNFILANSIDNKNVTKFSNSIIHISFKSLF